jgi:hypothetical protein
MKDFIIVLIVAAAFVEAKFYNSGNWLRDQASSSFSDEDSVRNFNINGELIRIIHLKT